MNEKKLELWLNRYDEKSVKQLLSRLLKKEITLDDLEDDIEMEY